jgi:hypothetical protein
MYTSVHNATLAYKTNPKLKAKKKKHQSGESKLHPEKTSNTGTGLEGREGFYRGSPAFHILQVTRTGTRT